ncbi:DUF4080 domain-containing protein [Bacteroides gallinaceum]|uniref:B12-binding domain-containing radical SAM protein n=1 Tax=Bacteroides gallinaceum TaxID=1462571 RepID=UPI0025A49793|nr:radical SAM protein [Bacteroides gallinaceum]MDM8155443.1 DUF4080 domain-containing protein [Bacteroides gallinaceum]
MKILWLDLNSSYAHSSLALPALQAQLIGRTDIEWDRISATINESPGMTSAEVFRRKPDIIAATCWLFNHEILLHTLGCIKALLPDCCITLGGPEFLGDNERFLRNYPFVNCVFRGEGEETFARWLEVWDKPEAWHTITGLCYIDPTSTYHDNGRAQVIRFDRLISPEESPFFNWSKPFVQLETTRGCFNTCAFCVSGGEKPVRTLPIETIRKRISLIQEHHIRNIRVLDRTFNYNARHARALLNLFREFPDIHFHLEVHPALLTEELKHEIASMPSGQLHLEAGIQSLHQEVLDVCRRHGTLEDALEGLKYLCSLPNLETHADLIAGLPLYRLEEIFEDIRILASYRAGEIQLESLKLLPGTEMRRRSEELGIRYSPFPPYEVLQTREISPDELQTARLLSRLLDGFYNAKPWQEMTRRLIVEEYDFLHRFLDFLIRIGVIDQPMSLERRGILLYKFCKENYPRYETDMTLAWIEAGMSLKKEPAYRIRTKHVLPSDHWDVLYGTYHESLRLCTLPPAEGESTTYWFGFEPESQQTKPIFKAKASTEKLRN